MWLQFNLNITISVENGKKQHTMEYNDGFYKFEAEYSFDGYMGWINRVLVIT